MDETKPKLVRKLELHVDIDATADAVWKAVTEGKQIANWFSPEASNEGEGVGSAVTFAWSEQMRWTTHVDAWQPGKMVRWLDNNLVGDGTVLTAEWTLTTAGGKTRLTLVQSGFGESEAWDGFFDGTEVGWTYFLQNLRIYLETHAGRVRHMISERFEVTVPRDVFWRHLLSGTAGLIAGGAAAAKVGDWVDVQLSGRATARAAIEVMIEGRALALRVADLQNSLLFFELEMGQDSFHLGCWFSVYDGERARELEEPAKRAFERIRSSLAAPQPKAALAPAS